MLHFIFIAVGAAVTAVIYGLSASLSLWWLLPILAGCTAAAVVLYVLGLWLVSLTFTKKDPPPFSEASRRTIYITLGWAMDMLGLRTHLTGVEKLPTDRPFLLVCNHLSNADPLLTLVALKKWKLAFISKPENFKIPIAGAFMHNASFLAIDRENPRNAVKTIHQAADFIKERQMCIGIYPEGTRNKERTGLLPFHNGSFKIAKMATCPIVVMTLRYGKKKWLLGTKPVQMDIIDVLDEGFVAENNTASLSDTARQMMESHLAQ